MKALINKKNNLILTERARKIRLENIKRLAGSISKNTATSWIKENKKIRAEWV